MKLPQETNHLRRHLAVWRRTLRQFGRHRGMAAAGNMAFLAMLSLFPFIIFLIALSGFLGQTERGLEAIQYLFDALPKEVSEVIDGPIRGIIDHTGAELLTGSILFAIWTAANGIDAARDVLIAAFGKTYARPIWIRRAESLIMVVFGAATVILAMSILVLGPAIFKAMGTHFPDAVTETVETIWNYSRLLFSPIILFAGIYVAYLTLTPRRIKTPVRIPGTLFCLVVFFAVANGLSVYLRHANSYDLTYGSLAGVVILQLFCFFVSFGFVIGAEMNAAYTAVRRGITRQDIEPPEIMPDEVTEEHLQDTADTNTKDKVKGKRA